MCEVCAKFLGFKSCGTDLPGSAFSYPPMPPSPSRRPTIVREAGITEAKLDEPQSIEELCDYIVRYASTIAVREEVEGRWGSHFLTELPAQKAIERALEFVRSGRVPTRMLTQKETDQRNATPKEE